MNPKKGMYSKTMVAVIVLLNVVFTYYALEVFKVVGSEPTTLIVSWFGFTTSELFMISSIKKVKEKKKGSGEK